MRLCTRNTAPWSHRPSCNGCSERTAISGASFNTVLLFVLLNLVVGYAYSFFDRTGTAAKAKAVMTTSSKGRPKATRQRSTWQLDHVDTEAYEGRRDSK